MNSANLWLQQHILTKISPPGDPRGCRSLKKLDSTCPAAQSWITGQRNPGFAEPYFLSMAITTLGSGWTIRNTVSSNCFVSKFRSNTSAALQSVISLIIKGWGTQEWKSSGAIYNGEWKFGKHDGYGIFSVLRLDTKKYITQYCGEWKNGMKHVGIYFSQWRRARLTRHIPDLTGRRFAICWDWQLKKSIDPLRQNKPERMWGRFPSPHKCELASTFHLFRVMVPSLMCTRHMRASGARTIAAAGGDSPISVGISTRASGYGIRKTEKALFNLVRFIFSF